MRLSFDARGRLAIVERGHRPGGVGAALDASRPPGVSGPTQHDPVGDFPQPPAARTERRERRAGIIVQCVQTPLRFVDAEQRDESHLALHRVLACRLAERCRRSRDVQNVVADLEREPGRACITIERSRLCCIECSAAPRAELHGGANQRTGLQRMHLRERFDIERPAGRVEVELLAAGHPGLARSRSDARRVVAEGGAYLNNVRVSEAEQVPAEGDLLHGRWLVVRRGKRNVALAEVRR